MVPSFNDAQFCAICFDPLLFSFFNGKNWSGAGGQVPPAMLLVLNSKLYNWGHANKGGSLDKCSVYDLDYTNVDAMKEASNGSQLTNQTRYCKSWIFAENETQTLITEVSLKSNLCLKLVSQCLDFYIFIFFRGGSYSIHFINILKDCIILYLSRQMDNFLPQLPLI